MKKWSNQYKRTRNAYPGRASGLLDNTQKAAICILAREAFLETELVHSAENLAEWRRQEQSAAIGKESLTDCTQADYLPLQRHFLKLKGETGRAFKTVMKEAVSEKEIALHKLKESCAERGINISYPAKICKMQNKGATLEDASVSAKKIWNLNFTVRNRRKPCRASVADAGVSNHPF